MYVKRMQKIAYEVFNILHKKSPVYLHDMFSIRNTIYNLRQHKNVAIPKFKSEKYGRRSFSYQGALIWNSITDKDFSNQTEFKTYLRQNYKVNCACSNCIICTVTYI